MRFVIPFALAMLAGCSTTLSGQRVLEYEPAVVRLEGRLSIAKKFGPPNWGESRKSRKTDEKLQVPILHLTETITVKGDENPASINQTTERDVREVQLNGLKSYKDYRDCDLVAEGTLHHAHTGWHFTDVRLELTSLRCKEEEE